MSTPRACDLTNQHVAKLLQTHRQSLGASSTPSRTVSHSSKPSFDRKESASYSSPKSTETATAYAPRIVAAPPPYTTTQSSASITKKAPPPPPPLKPKPSYNAVKYCTAIFDFEAQVSLCFHKVRSNPGADSYRPTEISRLLLATGSRSLSSPRALMIGGPVDWMDGRVFSLERIHKWTERGCLILRWWSKCLSILHFTLCT